MGWLQHAERLAGNSIINKAYTGKPNGRKLKFVGDGNETSIFVEWPLETWDMRQEIFRNKYKLCTRLKFNMVFGTKG